MKAEPVAVRQAASVLPRVARGTRVLIAAAALAACSANRAVAPTEPLSRNDAVLVDVEERTFRWFWERTNPVNGLTPDRDPTPSFSSVAAIGFALTAYPIGAERGWVTRAQAADRVLTTLRFLYQAPQTADSAGSTGHRGFFYHFLDMDTGRRFAAVELSTIDTALLLAGVLFCQEYFDEGGAAEESIRAYADSLYHRVDWRWAQPASARISMGWRPENGFIPHEYRGYNEAMILYILALGSPTHAVEPAAWTAYTSTYMWGRFHGQEYLQFAPHFGHQFSHIWIDFRGIQDEYMRGRGIDYFENSRRATYGQRQYAIDNPNGWRDYGADVFAVTASDGPADVTLTIDGRQRRFISYAGRGAGADHILDDGTIAPMGVVASIPFAPEITIPAMKAMRERYGSNLYSTYGFLDAFNPTFRDESVRLTHGRVVPGVGWFDTDYLGIDQGPIVAMIENYRSELVWREMRESPYIIRGLRRAGFTGGWLDRAPATAP